MLGSVGRAHPRTCEPIAALRGKPADECIEPIEDDRMNSPRTPLIVTLCGRRARGQFFSFIQMMLDGGKCLLSKLLQIRIVPFRPVFFKEVHRFLMGIDLLLGVSFVQVISRRTIEIVDKLLVLASNLVGRSTLIFFVFTMPVSCSVVLV